MRSYPGVVVVICGGSDSVLGDHFRVMGNRSWADMGGADVSCTATLYIDALTYGLMRGPVYTYASGVGTIALIAVDSFTDNLAINVSEPWLRQ